LFTDIAVRQAWLSGAGVAVEAGLLSPMGGMLAVLYLDPMRAATSAVDTVIAVKGIFDFLIGLI